MLAAATVQARTPRLYLQCRRKSTLSAINRTLDQSIRRDRRRALDDLNKVNDERGATFPWQDPNHRPRFNDSARNNSPDHEDREDRHTSKGSEHKRNIADRNAGFIIRKSNKRPEGSAVDENSRHDILNVPFTDKHHFTQENWNRLMDAVQLAEDKYVRALPTRPSVLPRFEKDEPSVTLKVKRELKKTFKQDLAAVEPTLSREKNEWLRVIQHVGNALKNARSNNIFIPGRRWFEESDPISAIKASHYPIQPSPTPTQGANRAQELQEMSVLNKNMRSTILQALVDKNAAAVISGQELRPVDLTAALDVSRSAKQAKEKDEEMQRDSFKEAKERRKLEEESRLDDDQLFSLINNNREKNNDRKNKYKEIQEPRDRRDRDSRSSPQSSRDDRDAYVSIPYTTAASEFLYGFNVVIAALTARRRQMYNVYIHSRALSNSSSASNIKSLCRKAGVKFTEVDDSWLPKMDKMAQGRPHNGLILEASPLPTLPTKSLGKIGVTDMAIPIDLADQSAEQAKVNGTPSTIPFHYAHTWRKPLVLLLDGILDPGNLGNILRTAHFYGIDAVAICTNTCAPVNLPIVQKAASGAAEALTILSIPTPANFITTCKKHGWTVHAAVAPNATSAKSSKGNLVTSNMISPLSRSPSILMIGAEGEGLRANLATKADANVGIRGAKPALPELDVGVDSLNVGSSVAVLLEAFFKKPDNLEDVPEDTPRDDTVSGRIV
ncbi:alpha/beta knot, partial [Aureobasidium melanogenum]